LLIILLHFKVLLLNLLTFIFRLQIVKVLIILQFRKVMFEEFGKKLKPEFFQKLQKGRITTILVLHNRYNFKEKITHWFSRLERRK